MRYLDSDAVTWREVTGDGFSQVHYVRHDYTILAHDPEAGTLDMLVRWHDDGGHCPLHRHTAATSSVLVLEGEQHVRDILPDGTLAPVKIRRAATTRSCRANPTPTRTRRPDRRARLLRMPHPRRSPLRDRRRRRRSPARYHNRPPAG